LFELPGSKECGAVLVLQDLVREFVEGLGE
jgi:hypothetical protein